MKPCRTQRRSLGLAEVALSSLVVAVMLLAALQAVGGARLVERTAGERARGQLLAQELMSEILAQAYKDPTAALPGILGLEAGESAAGTRNGFDDVDDYDNWTECSLSRKDGTALADANGWCWEVDVHYVVPSEVDHPTLIDTGIKRITVSVKWNGIQRARLVALKTNPP